MLRRVAALLLVAGCQIDPPFDEATFVCQEGTCPLTITVGAPEPDHQIRVIDGALQYGCARPLCTFDLSPRRTVTLSIVPERTVRWYSGEDDLGSSASIDVELDGPKELRVDFRPNPDTFRPDAPNVIFLLDDSASMSVGHVDGLCPYDVQVNGNESLEAGRSSRAVAMRAALNGCEGADDGALRQYEHLNLGIVEIGESPRLLARLGSDTERLESAVRPRSPEGPCALHEGLGVAVAHASEAIATRTGATNGRLDLVLFADGLDTASPRDKTYRWACDGAAAAVQSSDGDEATRLLLRYLTTHDVLCELPGIQVLRLHLISFGDATSSYAPTVVERGGMFLEASSVSATRDAVERVLQGIE